MQFDRHRPGLWVEWVPEPLDPYYGNSLFCVNCIYYLSGEPMMGPFSRGSIITQAQKQSTVSCSVLVSLFLWIECGSGSTWVVFWQYLQVLAQVTQIHVASLREKKSQEECPRPLTPPGSPCWASTPMGWWGPCEVRRQWFGRDASCELLTRIMTLPIHYSHNQPWKGPC